MAQLLSTCFFVLQFYHILLLIIIVNGKNDKFVFNPRQGKKLLQIVFLHVTIENLK